MSLLRCAGLLENPLVACLWNMKDRLMSLLIIIPTYASLKKRRGYCDCLLPSVCLLCYLRNHWTKSHQIWCVKYSYESQNGACNSSFYFWPHLLGLWGGVKRSNIIKFQLESQFQRFLYQTLCVLSQIKDIKHIKRDFHSVAWVMP